MYIKLWVVGGLEPLCMRKLLSSIIVDLLLMGLEPNNL